MKNAIAVFSRAPVPGEVKTRIARHIGNDAAAELYAAMLRDTLSLAQRVARSINGCEVVLVYTPSDAFDEGPHSLASFWRGPRLAQHGEDLGDKMLDCIRRLQEQGRKRVVVIGSDSPDLLPALISDAFACLSGQAYAPDPSSGRFYPQDRPYDLIFGPARDGGFYLIGASGPVSSDLFSGVNWNTRKTLSQVKANVAQLQLLVKFIQKWDDVDTLQDLRKLSHRLQGGYPHVGTKAPETWRWLRSQNLFQGI